MSQTDAKLAAALAAIDAANANDPHVVEAGGQREPAELVYGRRMSATLARMVPNASKHLQIAARGQHIERWTSARKSFPEGRAGYLRWRNELKAYHARRIGEIMTEVGYGADDVARVGSLVRKEGLKLDAEAQTLEDVACVVFLEHYLADFIAKTDQAKLPGILAKTWIKMSDQGHEHALKLGLPPDVSRMLEQGLAQLRRT